MGEIADAMLDGMLCQVCGVYMGDDVGYPRTCRSCRVSAKPSKPSTNISVAACAICGKRFGSQYALQQHKMMKGHGKRAQKQA